MDPLQDIILAFTTVVTSVVLMTLETVAKLGILLADLMVEWRVDMRVEEKVNLTVDSLGVWMVD